MKVDKIITDRINVDVRFLEGYEGLDRYVINDYVVGYESLPKTYDEYLDTGQHIIYSCSESEFSEGRLQELYNVHFVESLLTELLISVYRGHTKFREEEELGKVYIVKEVKRSVNNSKQYSYQGKLHREKGPATYSYLFEREQSKTWYYYGEEVTKNNISKLGVPDDMKRRFVSSYWKEIGE